MTGTESQSILIIATNMTKPIEGQCPDCGGNGSHIHDTCDHNGEHVQTEFPCETCGGSGDMPEGYKKTEEYYYTAPSSKIFGEVKEQALLIWSSYEDPYKSDKISRVENLQNVSDNLMYIVAMFDITNQTKLAAHLSEEARTAIRERLVAGGAIDYFNPF
jgi:hypothetical protein